MEPARSREEAGCKWKALPPLGCAGPTSLVHSSLDPGLRLHGYS